MATWTPDPTFYPSPRLAGRAPAEKLAYVAEFDPGRSRPDRIAVVDVDPASPSHATIVGRVAMPTAGDELHHFGWNACSSCALPERAASAPRAALPDRARYPLLAHPRPRHQARPEAAEARQGDRARGGGRSHRVHAPAHGALRARRHLRQRARQRRWQGPGRRLPDGPRQLRGARPLGGRPRVTALRLRLMAWHLGYDTAVTSEWGTPDMFESGLVPELLLGSKYGRRLHFWDLAEAAPRPGDRLGCRAPARLRAAAGPRPDKAYGFVGVRGQPEGPVLLHLAVAP